MIGSAFWSADAAAIGAAPTRTMPTAPTAATERALADARVSRSAAGRSASIEKPVPVTGTTCRSA